MLRSVQVVGFRGFNRFELHELGRVNLLVGANGSGKTALLEAIELLVSGNLGALSMSMWRRGEKLLSRRIEPLLDVRRLFFGFDLGVKRAFRVVGVDEAQDSSQVSFEVRKRAPASAANSGWNELEELLEPIRTGQARPRLELSVELGAKRSHRIPLNERGGAHPKLFQEIDPSGSSPTVFVTTASLTPAQVYTLAEELGLQPEEKFVLETLQLIEPKIEAFRAQRGIVEDALASGGATFGREGIIVRLAGHAEPVPIGSLGEGVYRMLGLALALVRARAGVLLIDEIDTGLHYTVMDKMWRMVKTTAERLDVQVFATTHSRDCFQSLATIVDPGVTRDSEVTIQRVDPGSERSVAFNKQEIALAAERGYEVR